MITLLINVASLLFVGISVYLICYLRFRSKIARQTKQMIDLMKAEDIDNLQVGDIYSKTDAFFSDLERAAMNLRRKYLRLRRLSQEERKGYETVFSGLKEGIVTVDQNLKVISFNSAFMNFFKWVPGKSNTHYYLHDAIRDPQIINTFKNTFESSQIQKSEVEQYQLFVTPLPSRNENESWCLGVFYDLTEVRKTERIRVDFVANASHEMRTPLTVIKGYADLLRQNFEASNSNQNLELLKPILQSADNMSDLLNELLNLAKLDVGVALVKNSISTEQITYEVLNELEGIAKLNNKKINVGFSAQNVWASAEALKQILRNLLINAIKYSGNSDEIKIIWNQSSDHVSLIIKDNGPGIPKEHQDRIFERFYRVDKGRARDQGGFGLGLAMVKHHMLNHGGNIKLISDTQIGSEFICEFPNIK